RPVQVARSMQHRNVFGIAPGLHAKGAAEIFGKYAQLLGLDAHSAGDLAAHGGNTLRAAAQNELVLAGVVARGRRAWLDRGYHQTLIDQFDTRYMGRVPEGAIERSLLLAVGIWRRSIAPSGTR